MISRLRHINKFFANNFNSFKALKPVTVSFHTNIDNVTLSKSLSYQISQIQGQQLSQNRQSFENVQRVAIIHNKNILKLTEDDSSENVSNNNPNNSNNGQSGNQNPNNSGNNNNDDSNSGNKKTISLKTIPMRNWKATDLTEEELKLTPQTHIIFSSQQPILPYSKVPCQMKTGNLTEINHELAYFILNEAGDVYQIGLELEKNVGKQLSKSFKGKTTEVSTTQQNFGQVNVDLAPKKLSHRVKIIEIQVNSNGIFAKTIPYKDDKNLSKVIDKFNLERELYLLRSLVQNIKKSVSYEKIEVIGPQEIETANLSEANTEMIDRMIFQIIGGIAKLYQRYMKENINLLIQTTLESKNVVERVLFLRQNLESLNDVMEIVNRNFKLADDNLIRMQTQTRARLSMEYIRQAYLANDKQGQQNIFGPAPGFGGQAAGGQTQKLVQQYMSKLHLIEDEPSKERVRQEIERFSQIDKHSSEFNKINTYLDEVFSIPWNKYTPANWDIGYAKKVLDDEIYGLEKVKERIIEMIAVNQMKNTHSKSKGFILLLQGPPGTGKTSIAKAVAKALQKENRFISFAGISDPSFFKGHRRTYVDSQPGVFIKELIKAQTMNPVFILDEIDKISKSSMGADPYYSLMEILNPEENNNFTDHYMDIKVDFSNTIFILTANNIMNMLEPLKNRLEIIDVPAYIEEEKLQISKKFIIPKAIKSNGINENLFKYNDQTISQVIKNWCYDEAGVRSLKRCFETISRKYAVELLTNNPELVQLQQQSQQAANQKEKELYEEQQRKLKEQQTQTRQTTQQNANNSDTVQVNTTAPQSEETQNNTVAKKETTQEISYPTILNDQTVQSLKLPVLDLTQSTNQMDILKKYLGVPRFDAELDSRQSVVFAPGIVNIMSVGGFVGHIMKIECVFDSTQLEKKGTFSSSGNLQQVLQESLTIAKINAFNYLKEDKKKLLSEKNVHIHFMSGAIPKDGPSAGIAICTAYLSLAMGKSVPANIAMTGELSLTGEVCKIGGLQAKIIAAKTLNIDQIICPYSNLSDVHDFPRLLLDGLTIYFVKEYKQVYDIVFEDKRGSLVPKGVVVLKNGNFINNPLDVQINNQNNTELPFNSNVIMKENNQ
ncbi:hypothetical protein ABPG74_020644 [Tetrahymena malaccensis]